MENQEEPRSEKRVQEQSENSEIEIQVEHFPVAKAKFSKEDWDSGEGSHDGEHG